MALRLQVLLSHLLPLFLLLALGYGKNEQTKFTIHNCTAEDGPFKDLSVTNISYTIASKNSSCMHYVWSMVGNLTMYLAHTTDKDSCNCSQSRFNHTVFPADGSISIPGLNSDFSLAVVFTRVIEFNATKHDLAVDSLYLPVACNTSMLEANQSYSHLLFDDSTRWTFSPENRTFIGSWYNKSAFNDTTVFKNRTRFSIRITLPEAAHSGRLKYFPKTLFTDNSTVFDVISENYPYAHNNANSRLALEVMIVHGPNVSNGSISMGKSPDDEFTPSVFTTYTYHTSVKNQSHHNTGFAQWKPISYQSSSRKSTESQQVVVVPTAHVSECEVNGVPRGLASALFGSGVGGVGNVTRWFVVFGTPGDENYINPTYNTWTVVAGYGDVPKDGFSAVIIITIIVGVGVPALLVVLGGVYVFIKKRPWQNIHRFVNSKRGRGYSRLS